MGWYWMLQRGTLGRTCSSLDKSWSKFWHSDKFLSPCNVTLAVTQHYIATQLIVIRDYSSKICYWKWRQKPKVNSWKFIQKTKLPKKLLDLAQVMKQPSSSRSHQPSKRSRCCSSLLDFWSFMYPINSDTTLCPWKNNQCHLATSQNNHFDKYLNWSSSFQLYKVSYSLYCI